MTPTVCPPCRAMPISASATSLLTRKGKKKKKKKATHISIVAQCLLSSYTIFSILLDTPLWTHPHPNSRSHLYSHLLSNSVYIQYVPSYMHTYLSFCMDSVFLSLSSQVMLSSAMSFSATFNFSRALATSSVSAPPPAPPITNVPLFPPVKKVSAKTLWQLYTLSHRSRRTLPPSLTAHGRHLRLQSFCSYYNSQFSNFFFQFTDELEQQSKIEYIN